MHRLAVCEQEGAPTRNGSLPLFRIANRKLGIAALDRFIGSGRPTERHLHHGFGAGEGASGFQGPNSRSMHLHRDTFEKKQVRGGEVEVRHLRRLFKAERCKLWHCAFGAKEARRSTNAPHLAKPFRNNAWPLLR